MLVGRTATASLVFAAAALGQATEPTVFVGNNGNLLGAMTSLQPDASGALVQVDYLVIDERAPGGASLPGTNVEGIALSPGGRFLATGHATALDPEQLTIIEVDADGTLEVIDTFSVPNAPLGMAWIDDQYIAVAESNFGSSFARVYRYTPGASPMTGSLVEVDATPEGSFITNIEADHDRRLIFVQDSDFGGGSANVTAYEVDASGALDEVGFVFTAPNFALGMALAPNGEWLYAGGGISGTGREVLGFRVGVSGSLEFMPGAPFASPGDSPAWVTVSPDNRFVYAGHGRDATVQGFSTDNETGALTALGVSFDVGSQGTLGTVGTLDLPAGQFLVVTDNSTIFDDMSGIYSFRIEDTGDLTQIGDIVMTPGSQPDNFVVWQPGGNDCRADLDGDGQLTIFDFLEFQNLFDAGDPAADFDGDGDLTIFDFLAFQNEFDAGCE
ncbi:MAG: GC-type dockerin domain-anchored protein [Phycisphaerales bacterium JB060]